eukprot:CAMPEP_0202476086 /NCGR_PEP_ID=MMETSP1360-20130828/93236_1 /ASSEMBLY_ACC=CAM_ASM_000848 /TAXON_ID=515479 /ORGANISM="Licmophora paradoxa, Strain CCMP2313" /LENGTH=220 /DNA_ID=CAMNT_0049103275 /DNA_START=51 /DNA_END=713 /DNA_ORIENTATION=-
MMNMNTYKLALTVMAMISSVEGFVIMTPLNSRQIIARAASSTPYFVDIIENEDNKLNKRQNVVVEKEPIRREKSKTRSNKSRSHGKDGIFTPVVKASKFVLGSDRLNKVRGNAIGMHSNVIASFVETSNSAFGQTVLKQLFRIADKDGSGNIDKEELSVALRSLGFELSEKQISGIFDRADKDKSGDISMEEWIREAPKTLRTNLTKLAKKNGGELGFLS